MKKLTKLILVFVFSIIMAIPVMAFADTEATTEEGKPPMLVDEAGVLKEDEKASLEKKLESISSRQEMDVAVVVKKSLDGKNAQEVADDYYDYNGYGVGDNYDGLMLLVSTEDRKWHITTCGYGITAFTDAGLGFLSEKFLPYMGDDKYYEAFDTFADWSEKFIIEAKENKPYDTGHMPKEKLRKIWILYDLLIGIALVTGYAVLKAFKLKSVTKQHSAEAYTREESMVLTGKKDVFVNRVTTSRTIESSSGSSEHSGSSGRSHGGTGGSF